MSVLSRKPVTPPIPRVAYCMDCGSRLIRQHYRLKRPVGVDYAADVERVDVDRPYCIYEVRGKCQGGRA